MANFFPLHRWTSVRVKTRRSNPDRSRISSSSQSTFLLTHLHILKSLSLSYPRLSERVFGLSKQHQYAHPFPRRHHSERTTFPEGEYQHSLSSINTHTPYHEAIIANEPLSKRGREYQHSAYLSNTNTPPHGHTTHSTPYTVVRRRIPSFE